MELMMLRSFCLALTCLVFPFSCQEWDKFAGTDCYAGKGGDIIYPEPFSDEMTLERCKDTCLEEPGCEGIIRKAEEGTSAGLCYLRKNIRRGACAKDQVWDLHQVKGGVKPSSDWNLEQGLDCYAGKGGDPILPDPFGNSLSLQECRAACEKDAACEGVIRKAEDKREKGICYKRKNLQLGKCVQDPVWDLHQKLSKTGTTTTRRTTKRTTTTTRRPPTNEAWKKLGSLDCYQGKGGDPILPDPFSNSVTLAQCKAACKSDASCQGIIRKSTDGRNSGICYKRKNLVVAQCVADPTWELHVKPNSGVSTATTKRPPTTSYGCKYGIQGYPRNLPNAHYYTRLCTTNNNLKIISANRASNAALERTAYLIDNVMAKVDPRVAQSMNARGFRHAVMAAYPSELTTHIPEHAWLGAYWNERARGLGATVALPVGSSAEENALCHANDRYRSEDITIHEFAHSLHLLGFALVYPNFNSELTALYNAARSRNLWGTGATGSYAMTDFKEYFAEGVQSYFDTNAPDSYAPVTRNQLYQKDPNFYNFLNRYLGGNPWKRTPC